MTTKRATTTAKTTTTKTTTTKTTTTKIMKTKTTTTKTTTTETTKRQRPKIEFNIGTSGQFRTLAMFLVVFYLCSLFHYFSFCLFITIIKYCVCLFAV